MKRPDLFAPALSKVGLKPGRVIYLAAGDERALLACFEEGLRHGGLGAVGAEVSRLSMPASRRLQLAVKGASTLGLALRRWRRQAEAAEVGHPARLFPGRGCDRRAPLDLPRRRQRRPVTRSQRWFLHGLFA